VKGEFQPRTGHEGLEGVEVELCCNFNLGASSGWVVKAMPRALCARAKRPGTHCTRGCWGGGGAMAGVDGYGKFSHARFIPRLLGSYGAAILAHLKNLMHDITSNVKGRSESY
jgi:hypothetical protein